MTSLQLVTPEATKCVLDDTANMIQILGFLGLLVCFHPSCSGQQSWSELPGYGVTDFSSKLHYNVLFPDSQSCPQSSESPVRHLQAVNVSSS